jgi:outer membrane protein assembly factor BamB
VSVSAGRPRVPVVFVALLAATAGAGAGAYKRWAAHARHVQSEAGGPAIPKQDAPSASASAAFVSRAPEPQGPARSFRGDRARRHRTPFLLPRETPRTRFTWDAGGPIEAMPAITKEGDLVVASLSGRVARLSPEGKVAWTADLGERIYSSPLVLGESVVLGSDAKRVVALALATGKTRWQLDVDGECDTAAAETPDGAIVIAAGRVLYGLRADGAVRFRLKLPRKIYASPAIADDGTIYVGAQDKKLYAVSARGAVTWSRELGGDVDCAPAIGDDGTVFAASDAGRVVAFDAQGNEKWRANVGGFVRGGLTVSRSGAVIAGTYGPGPRVVALDGASGEERWSFRIQGTGAPEFGIHGSPLEDPEGRLYFGAHDDTVYALDAGGRLLWTFRAGGDVDAPITAGPGGVLYAGSDDGKLYALY